MPMQSTYRPNRSRTKLTTVAYSGPVKRGLAR